MGKQVNFYLKPDDIDILEINLKGIGPFIILHSRSESKEPRQVKNFNIFENEINWLYFYLVRLEDLNSVVMNHVPAQNYWAVDTLYSPVIEFTRCFFDDANLRRGRMYFIESYYDDNDKLVSKPETFLNWANAILKATKKSLVKKDKDYFGKNALAWLETSGGKLLE